MYENILLDLDRHQLSVDGRTVPLTPHEFTLLETLMAAPGRAFSRDALLSTLYPHGEAMVIDRVVDVHIGKLRQKIEPMPSAPSRILTVRGIGYRFADPGPIGDATVIRHLIVKLLLVHLVVIAFVMVVVWLAIDTLAAGYFVTLMEKYNISPKPAHAMFVSAVHRYLVWACLAAVILAAVLVS